MALSYIYRIYAGRKMSMNENFEPPPSTPPIPDSIVRQVSAPISPCIPPSKKPLTSQEKWQLFKRSLSTNITYELD